MTWVLDTSALICWLDGEPGVQRMRDILADGTPALIHAVNLVEAQYLILRRDEQAWPLAVDRIQAVGVQIARELDDDLLEVAARLKAFQAPIALGDVFAVALTVRRGATLVTTDRGELEKVEAAGVCAIEFLR